MTLEISRRALMAGGGLLVSFTLVPAFAQQAGVIKPPTLPGSLKTTPLLDAWIRVDPDSAITVFTGKAELGQGIKTALTQIAADELDVGAAMIKLITADTGQTPNEGITSGSHSMQDSGTAIRNAAANVRALLLAEAAKQWGVPASTIRLQNSAAIGTGGKQLSYGALVQNISLHVEAQPDAPLNSGPALTLIGKPLPRVDIPRKLTGGQAYVQDLRLPGMVHARVVRGPSENTRLNPLNVQEILAMPGVIKMVQNGHFTAIIAAKEWQAIQALRKIQQTAWTPDRPLPQQADIFQTLQQSENQDDVILNKGMLGAAQVKVRYTKPYLLHGSIGPSCAVAHFVDGMLTVWTHTQGVYPLRGALADMLHMPLEKIRCIHTEGSGCYGHNGADDVAADAALAAIALPGTPVRLQWMRDQEHGWEPMGPAMIAELSAALDATGHIVSWTHDVWSNTHNGRPTTGGGLLAGLELEPPFVPPAPKPIPQPEGGGDRNAIPLYVFPNAKVVSHFLPQMPLRVSALRSLGGYLNVFAIESFMDELADKAGVDPVEFRQRHLQDPRAIAVVEKAAELFGWKKSEAKAEGYGRGFAFAKYKNLATYCAIALDLQVAPGTGAVSVQRVVAAVDSGQVVNPDGLRNQIEGGIVQSLSWTLLERMNFDSKRRTGADWATYRIARFSNVPAQVEVAIIDRPDQPFLGAGEAAQGPASAALANALARASGKRSRDMPLVG